MGYNDAGKMLTFIKFSESDSAGDVVGPSHDQFLGRLFRDESSRSYGSLAALPSLSGAQPTELAAASRRGVDGMDDGASYTRGISLPRQLHSALWEHPPGWRGANRF